MCLWLLRPIEDRTKDDDPWTPWYDCCFGLVVRATTEDEARTIAAAGGGQENSKAWSATYSTCVPLTDEGDPGVIIQDVWYA